MNVSLAWLSDHLDLTGHSPESLADALTFAGVEVEAIHARGVSSDKVVVAQVTEYVPHPNADRLRLCQVDDGSGQPRQIVCGATNFQAGDKVPLALPGAVLPGGFEIKESKLRGVLSQGMLCSGRELNLSTDAAGLLVLGAEAPVGRPLREIVDSDTIFEVEITPNRPDLLSHLGVARELSALTGLPLKGPAHYAENPVPLQTAENEVRIDDPTGCPFYTARRIRGVKVAPSPDWLRRRLESAGLRPVNNVVDITNFVLMEMGQPLHAFDAAKLSGGIIVRRAREGESFRALDGKDYALSAGDLVIADAEKAAAIAGVMGGETSGVTETTTDLLLESACFQTTTVRRTSRRLGLVSDSSYRFERGIDPHQVAGASALATRLIVEIAGGTAEDVLLGAGAPPPRPSVVDFDGDRCRALLGTAIPDHEIDAILTSLALLRQQNDGGDRHAHWLPPTWRLDLTRPVDLIEEVARVYGIAKLPAGGAAFMAPESPADGAYDFRLRLRRDLAACGWWEAQTIKLVSAAQLDDALGATPQPIMPLPLKNPLSDDHTHMRPSLLPGLLGTAAHNIRMGRAGLRFVEGGTVFSRAADGTAQEKDMLGLLLCGPAARAAWNAPAPAAGDLYDLRGHIEAICQGAAVKFKPARHNLLLLAATIQVNGKPVGLGGRLQPARERRMDARHPVFVAEIDTTALQRAVARDMRFEELPRFPAITRDIAMEVADSVPNSKFEDFFAAVKEPLLAGAEVFDVFTGGAGQKLAPGRKSVAWSLTYRDPSKTLTTAEVDAAHQRVLQSLQKSLPVTLR